MEKWKAFVLTAQAVVVVWFCLCLWKSLAGLQAMERNMIYNRHKKAKFHLQAWGEEIGLSLNINVLHNLCFISASAVTLVSICNGWWKLPFNWFLQIVWSPLELRLQCCSTDPYVTAREKYLFLLYWNYLTYCHCINYNWVYE